MNRESNVAKTKKKPVQPKSKASQISTPRSSKPISNPTKTLTSASSTKKGNSSSLPKRQITSSMENKKVANRSLHMSMSLGSDPVPRTAMRKSLNMESMGNKDIVKPVPPTTMRKSLIMESMGDKDIVKRAFKTFQNGFNQLKTSGELDRSSVKKQVIRKYLCCSSLLIDGVIADIYLY